MHEIGKDTIETANGLIKVLLTMYKDELQAAYLKEENSLSVALSLKFKPSDVGGVEVDAGINFVTSRVKDNIKLDLDGTVLLRFGGYLKGVIRASQVCGGEENGITIAVYGSRASLKWAQENPNYLYMLSDTEPTRVFKPAHDYNGKFAEISHTMPPGHPEGIYEALANIYRGAAKSIRGEEFIPGEFPTVHEGVRGMKFIHAVVNSDANGNVWTKV